MAITFNYRNIISWIFGLIFIVLGVMNLILIHPVPGIFYLLLSVIYIIPQNILFPKRLGSAIPFAAKIVVALVILWGTLAVGDLAEMYGL